MEKSTKNNKDEVKTSEKPGEHQETNPSKTHAPPSKTSSEKQSEARASVSMSGSGMPSGSDPSAHPFIEKLTAAAGKSAFVRRLSTKKSDIYIVCLDEMCDSQKVNHFVLTSAERLESEEIASAAQILPIAALCAESVLIDNYDDAQSRFYSGSALLLVSGDDASAIALDTRTQLERAVAVPPTSYVVEGPREGFIEGLKPNITLLRKRLKTPNFKIETLTVGRSTNTAVAIIYLENICEKRLVDDIRMRISRIDIDGIIDSSYIKQFLNFKSSKIFPLIGTTEKPDIAAAKMLEGRVIILVDGSPIALTLPYMFVEETQSPDDYYNAPQIATAGRVLRLASAVISTLLPAVYVSVLLYSYQILPVKFLMSIMIAIQNIPFSPLIEICGVLLIFDILREASSRMPSYANTALSIVGALVLGDAAVKAGLLSSPAVIIGALSGIGLYPLPGNTLMLSLIRLTLTVIAGYTGLFGLIIAVVAILAFMSSLNSFGTPYLSPFAPTIFPDKEDALLKTSLFNKGTRPFAISDKNRKRMAKYGDEYRD